MKEERRNYITSKSQLMIVKSRWPSETHAECLERLLGLRRKKASLITANHSYHGNVGKVIADPGHPPFDVERFEQKRLGEKLLTKLENMSDEIRGLVMKELMKGGIKP